MNARNTPTHWREVLPPLFPGFTNLKGVGCEECLRRSELSSEALLTNVSHMVFTVAVNCGFLGKKGENPAEQRSERPVIG